jgi:hypothetical protein
MTTAPERGAVVAPERELIRRISPFALPAALVAVALGAVLGGSDAAWSAAIAIGIVYVNFLAHGWSLALAAAISPMALYVVGLGGFVVRLGILVVTIALLERLNWFSLPAFLAALVPATIALLAVEMKMIAGRLQADLWTFPTDQRPVGR